jgi:quinol-cytochrome oxidoreductase complex cytochrome b subunit
VVPQDEKTSVKAGFLSEFTAVYQLHISEASGTLAVLAKIHLMLLSIFIGQQIKHQQRNKIEQGHQPKQRKQPGQITFFLRQLMAIPAQN